MGFYALLRDSPSLSDEIAAVIEEETGPAGRLAALSLEEFGETPVRDVAAVAFDAGQVLGSGFQPRCRRRALDAVPGTAKPWPMNDLHGTILTLDSHIDIPWPEGPGPFEDSTRRVDLPKMRRGGVVAGCFAAYVPQMQRSPETEQTAFSRALQMLERIREMEGSANGVTARIADSADAVEAAWREGAIAVVPVLENGFSAGTDLSRLARFRALGARYLTLTHNGHNALADSANPRRDLGDPETEHGGLSGLGREAIGELNRLGIMVDVSHVSKAAMLQAAGCSSTPVVATHSCIRALCDHPRNLDDEQLDALATTGGLVQITAVSAFLKAQAKPDAVTVADFADHIDYAVRRIGVAHVGVSSDFDGGGGFSGWNDASESPNITAELARRGYGREEIAALWGGNFLRAMRAAEAAQFRKGE